MNDMINKVFEGQEIENILETIIYELYENGPVERTYLEILSYIKYLHPSVFGKYENDILNVMGLFFKNANPSNIRALIMKDFGDSINDVYGHKLTPIQMDIFNNIGSNKFFSFSAATSTGKSYIFRELLLNSKNDVLIIVPSRALINEYYIKIRDIFVDNKVNILTYVDIINKKARRRNIFILTPERAKETFKYKTILNIDFILFDEAQLSDEKSSRGVIFDTLVRRFKKSFPSAKMFFAYPFVDNPESQLLKNQLNDSVYNYRSYKEKNVGQIFFSVDNGKFYAFGIKKEVMGQQRRLVKFDPIENVLKNNGSILIYTLKSKILNEEIFDTYRKYCNLCEEITDDDTLKLIKKFDDFMGTSDTKSRFGYSQMSKLLRRGIIIHHGSLPLKARLIIEEITRRGKCRICFSTSTLVQGINMPFDLVLLDSFSNNALDIKNLIGRAGRSTLEAKFDYGIVVIKDNNKSDIRRFLNSPSNMSNVSLLDTDEKLPEDVASYKDAIINDKFNDDYNLTNSDMEKITTDSVFQLASQLLELLFINNTIIDGETFSNLPKTDKDKIYIKFQQIYGCYIGRGDLSSGEKSVLSNSIKILLWQIQGKKFKQIVGYRYSYIRQNNEIKKLLTKYRNNTSRKGFKKELEKIKVKSTMKYSEIPNKDLVFLPLFDYDLLAYDVSYDIVAFDTYDYIDRMIGFKLKDIYYALFNELYLKEKDERAKKMSLYIKYGTIDEKEIFLLRYGFDFDTIGWLKDKVKKIDEDEIIFNDLSDFTEEQLEEIRNYI